jgi:GNAT superfamily N-acetyltransferase
MKINIRKGRKEDLASALILIKELAEYENSLDEVTITLCDLQKDGFGKQPFFWFLVAEIDTKIVGLSFYFIRYSTWKGKFLFLEDFIIKKEFRRLGLGAKLFEATIKICYELKLNGLVWQVLDWNDIAIKFYKKYDTKISNDWLNGKLTKKQISDIYSNL